MRPTKNIALLAGDGIGPEVMAQAVKVIEALSKKFNLRFSFQDGLIGGIAIEKTSNPLPQETIELCKNSDAILLAAIGHPRYSDPSMAIRPEQGLLALRKELSLFCNVRPIQAYDSLLEHSPLKRQVIEGVDFVVYRELTGGIYFGESGRSADKKYAFDKCEYHDYEIERIVRLAFQAAEFPNVEQDFLYIDNACMQLILNPKQFDVIVTSNIFGDIISDEGSVIGGSLGLLPSASIGSEVALFEPVHGSWPEAAGKDIANPIAMILSTAMMMDYLNYPEAGQSIRQAVLQSMNDRIVTGDLHADSGFSCTEVGSTIAELI